MNKNPQFRKVIRVLVVISAALANMPVIKAELFWVAKGTNAIGRSKLDGSSVTPAFISNISTGSADRNRIAADGRYLYWISGETTIGRVRIDGEEKMDAFIAGGTALAGIAVDSNYIYFSDSRKNTVGRAALDGRQINYGWISDASNPVGIALSNDYLYYASYGLGFYARCDKATGRVISRVNSAGYAYDIVSIENRIFLFDSFLETGIIRSLPLAFTSVNYESAELLVVSKSNGRSFAVSSDYVFWLNNLDAKAQAQSIGRTRVYGGGAELNYIDLVGQNPTGICFRDEARLGVPIVVKEPLDQKVAIGSDIVLSVSVADTGGVAYKWRRNGEALAGMTAKDLVLKGARQVDAGKYDVVISNNQGISVSKSAAIDVGAWLSNLSVRTTMTNGQTLIVGAVIRGDAKEILVRAAGPALNKFGLAGMADPRLELYASGTSPVSTNDNWDASLSGTFSYVGAFPFDNFSRDSAISRTLSGSFTAQAKGTGPGAILVEAYDLSGGSVTRLINLSARNRVETGADILIAGFAISGTGTKQVLVRAVGPGLSAFGVPGFLADPKLDIYDGKGTIIATNDDWSSSLSPTFTQLAAFPLVTGSKDAALVVTLNAGVSYTVQVSGINGVTGEALVEVYEVP